MRTFLVLASLIAGFTTMCKADVPILAYRDLIQNGPNPMGILDNNFQIVEGNMRFVQLMILPQTRPTIIDCLAATQQMITHCSLGHTTGYDAVITKTIVSKLANFGKKKIFYSVHLLPTQADLKRMSSPRNWAGSDLFFLLCDTIEDYAIFMLDLQGNVITWNKGAERMKQYSADDIIGKHFSIFYLDEDLKKGKPQKELEIAQKEHIVQDEFWRKRKDGSLFWASVTITALWKDGRHIGYGKVTRDMTRIRAAYEEAALLKSNFLATASHELRSPLNGVLAGIQLLATTELSPEQVEIFTMIHQAGVTLSHIIDDLLIYTKLGAQKLTLKIATMDIYGILRNLVNTYQLQSPKTRICHVIDDSVPRFARGDPIRLTQILSNLIDNANKFTFDGSIQIYAVAEPISETDNFCLRVSVTDTGIGMNDEALSKLFQPFAQVDTSNNKRPGTGLGLSITRDIIHLMDGEINVKSAEGYGTSITFGVKLSYDNQKRKSSVMTIPTISNANQHVRILIAEDNLVNAKLLIKLLKKNGFSEIRHAENGYEAVNMVKHEIPDVILCDIMMPVMDGYTAATQIREFAPQVPIIALSANATPEDQKAAAKAGMIDHIAKPFDIRKVIAVIHAHTGAKCN